MKRKSPPTEYVKPWWEDVGSLSLAQVMTMSDEEYEFHQAQADWDHSQ